MKVFTPEISWHERDPIYTCAFSPTNERKFATAGVTGVIRLWDIDLTKDSLVEKPAVANNLRPANNSNPNGVGITFIANLKRHNKSVNVLRWNHDGRVLASAGDESVIFLWNENDIKNQRTLDNDEDENKENWFAFKTFRGHLEDILDISWSKDGAVLISGSVDNSVIVWNVSTGEKIAILKEPKGFVQGLVYDPLNSIFAVLSTDRCLRIYSAASNKCVHNINKIQLNASGETGAANSRIFHDDTMKSFFRRMCFSPDGNLLLTPSGCLEIGEKVINTSYIFTRNSYTKPVFYIPHDKPSVAISFCPFKFKLIPNIADRYKLNKERAAEDQQEIPENLLDLPYRYIFAIATEDSLYFYDTQALMPFSFINGIHYSNLSDLSWSSNGRLVILTSIDGFCTFVSFKEGELGEIYQEEEKMMVVETTAEKTVDPPMAKQTTEA